VIARDEPSVSVVAQDPRRTSSRLIPYIARLMGSGTGRRAQALLEKPRDALALLLVLQVRFFPARRSTAGAVPSTVIEESS